MRTTLNFRSVVFKRAYKLVRESGCTFSDALTQAWTRFREYKNRVVEEIVSKISKFDFYYYMSDDNRVFKYWSNVQTQINKQLSFNSCFIGTISKRITNQKDLKYFI